jgi:hypothetical protein
MPETIQTKAEAAYAKWLQITANVPVGVEIIRSEVAKKYILQNRYNRNYSDTNAHRLATKITNDSWIFNGDTIVFNTEGMLLNGQHRLQAIILSGLPIACVVVRGVDHPLAFRTYDIGKKRDFASALQIDGELHYRELSQAVSWMFTHTVGSVTVDMEEKHEMLGEHPTLRESCMSGLSTAN